MLAVGGEPFFVAFGQLVLNNAELGVRNCKLRTEKLSGVGFCTESLSASHSEMRNSQRFLRLYFKRGIRKTAECRILLSSHPNE